jgi:hypothetical protein
VYWRRRLFVIGSVVLLLVLLVLTIKAATGSDETTAAGADGSVTPSVTPSTTRSAPASSRSSARPSTSPRSGSRSSTASPPPPRCTSADLGVTAVVGKTSYHVGDAPVLELQVTNNGSKPCVQDLADKQIELRVYNGESRVWGSHDCRIEPGTNDRTLPVKMPIRVSLTWTGLTSQPKCAGTRQRVGAGTYTLYPVLSGKTGQATQFTIS